MSRIAIVTDSNSGVLPSEAETYEGVFVIPMPVIIGEDTYYEGIDITQQRFYEVLSTRTDLKTSQPSLADVSDLWDKLLEDYDEIVHIPMSSGLSGACESAAMLAGDYDGRVRVVNNQRISVTQKRSVYDAMQLRDAGMSAVEIGDYLEKVKFESSIYIMVDTLYYLKRGGRVTPAAAAIGTALKIKPVLQIQGEKLDAFTVARTVGMARTKMIDAIRKDMETRFGGASPDNISLDIAYTYNDQVAEEFLEQVKAAFPGFTDIKVVSDDSGWDKDNTILKMTVNDLEAFEQGKYYKSDSKIIIWYSSQNRIDVSTILKDWDNSKYTDVQSTLKSSGFTNITIKDKDEFSKEKDRLVADVSLNGQKYNGQQWFVPTNTPIELTYYNFKIKIGSDEKAFIGQEYQKVSERLKKAGFTNVHEQEVTDGWAKNDSIVSLIVNNSTDYTDDSSFEPNTKIMIKYSAGERIDITDILKEWDTTEAKSLKDSLEQKGFSDISIEDQTTNKKPKNKLVAEVLFNNKSFESGNCYLPKATKIVIMRYLLELMPGRDSSQYEGLNYQTIANELKEKGFTNIHLLRADDLVTGWVDGDKTIKSITINGKSSFSSTDKFTYSDRIDIVVHTFKFRDYDDITEKAP